MTTVNTTIYRHWMLKQLGLI